MAKPEYFLCIRTYPEATVACLWLIEKTETTEAGLLFGVLSLPRALALVSALEALGLPIEREEASYQLPVQGSKQSREQTFFARKEEDSGEA